MTNYVIKTGDNYLKVTPGYFIYVDTVDKATKFATMTEANINALSVVWSKEKFVIEPIEVKE